jgi:iron-sulfur cluster insertion protein
MDGTRNSAEAPDGRLTIAEGAVPRIAALLAKEGRPGGMFRVSVAGGGCSGFRYQFSIDDKLGGDDVVFERNGVKVVVDETSLELVKGSEIQFVEDLVGSAFALRNPNATSSCGCGTSFSIV